MPKQRLIALAVTTISSASAFQAIELPRSPYERRGIFHATVHGRVISPAGKPITGVHIQLRAGRPRSLPLNDVVTGADGQFTLSDVSTIYPPSIAWFPPEEWMNGEISLVGESTSDVDIGIIKLQPATIIRVAVEVVGGSPRAPGDHEPTVILDHGTELFGARIAAQRIGRELVLRGASFDQGTWEVDFFANGKIEEYKAPFHGRPGRRDQKFTLRLLRDSVRPTNEHSGGVGKMEVTEKLVPITPVSREFTVAGKVVGPAGTPIEGAIVSDFNLPFGESLVQWVRTGPTGDFLLKSRADQALPSVSYGDSEPWNLFFSKPRLREIPDEEWKRTTHTIVMPKPTRLSIRVSGLDPSKTRASWWHDSIGWQHFTSLSPWIPGWGLWDASIRISANGYLPLTQQLTVPYFDPSNQEPPSELPMHFQFDPTVRRTLSVQSAGKPLAGAIVDVESIVNLDSDQRRLLNSYRLPVDGRLQLLGGGDQIVEVFVYASGFEPKRAIWNPGTPLAVDLTPRSSTLEFPASSTVALARIRQASSSAAVRTVLLTAGRQTLAHFAPGAYDVTCYNTSGAVAGYQRLTVTAASRIRINCTADQRPRLTVRLPGEGWRLSVSESAPPGAATQWMAMIAVPGTPRFSEVSATPIRESKTDPVLALSHAGKWHIEAQEGRRSLSLWRDVDIEPGASITLAVPKETGTVQASMRTYGGGLERSGHGFAGPRLQLIADNAANWSVTEYLPHRDALQGEQRHHFTLTGIPVGDYHLYQHLIGEPKTHTYGGRTTTYTTPIAAWGGVPVHVTANSGTLLKDFSEYPVTYLQVRITDSGGNPVEHATLRIRDRMSDSWRQVQENPMQLEQAAHAIPYPAAVRIVRGKAMLPRIREGWLNLAVESDNGTAFSFTVPVSPKRQLNLTLPRETR